MPIQQSMAGKVILITGGSDGIGKQTALSLARMGACEVIAGRDLDKTRNAAVDIIQHSGSPDVGIILADLSIQSEVRRMADEFLLRYDRLDVLINNAGGIFMERTLSPDRIELTFALNHLSYFILTQLLLERLKSSAPSRVINVSSAAHLLAWLKLEDLEMSRGYSGWMAYSHTKLMNIYFTKELARQLDGSGVTANALHPGYIKTRLALNNKGVYPRLFKLAQVFASSAEKGAATPVFLASSPAAAKFSGSYFVNRRVTRSSRTSNDPGIAQKLWERSLQYIQ